MAVAQLRFSYPRLVVGSTHKAEIVVAGTPTKFYMSLLEWGDQCREVDGIMQAGKDILVDAQIGDACIVMIGEGDYR